MKPDCLNCWKYVVFFFNFCFFLGGACIIGLGIYALLQTDIQLPTNVNINYVVGVFVFIGSILFVAGFFGCCGAIRESKCMLMTYGIILLIIFLIQIAIVVVYYIYIPKVDAAIIDVLNSGNAKEYEAIENSFKCCGWYGPNDYTSDKPSACYEDQANKTGLYTVGCKTFLFGFIYYIGGVGIAVLLVEVLGMISACCLYKGTGSGYEAA